jgi:large subunit ribosomal protein L25
MRKDITVVAEPRPARGKNEARRLRVRGQIPAVLYGAGGGPVAVSVDPKEITKILHSNTGHNTIFNLDVKGAENSPVMIVDWQEDPVKSTLLHVDFKRIDLSRKLTVKVPVQLAGEARGVKQQGGLLEAVAREIEIRCLPDDIPEHLTADVTPLLIGQTLRASQVPLPEGVELMAAPDTVIAHVVALRTSAVTEGEEAPAAAAAEPEVIKKGKKEEEGGEKEKK